MMLDDTPLLLDSLLGFHRRVERHLALLASLPGLLEAQGPGPRTSAAAETLLQCFDNECARRHAEEERDLWPALERRIGDDLQRSHFRSLRRTLAEQHRDLERAWRDVRRPLHAVSEGMARRIEPDGIWRMRSLFANHIHAEEAALHRVAARVANGARH